MDFGIEELAEILKEALSEGNASFTVAVATHGSELQLSVLQGKQVLDSVSYGALGGLRASRDRMQAYSRCLARLVANAAATDRISEYIPAPALLALSELRTEEDFERARLDVDLEEHAVEALRNHAEET